MTTLSAYVMPNPGSGFPQRWTPLPRVMLYRARRRHPTEWRRIRRSRRCSTTPGRNRHQRLRGGGPAAAGNAGGEPSHELCVPELEVRRGDLGADEIREAWDG